MEPDEFERIWKRAHDTKAHDAHIAQSHRLEGPHPDMHRAEGGWAADSLGKTIRFGLLVKHEAKRLGALVIRVNGDPKTGRLSPDSMALFTKEELEFE